MLCLGPNFFSHFLIWEVENCVQVKGEIPMDLILMAVIENSRGRIEREVENLGEMSETRVEKIREMGNSGYSC